MRLRWLQFGDESARRAWIGVGAPILGLVLVIIALAIAAFAMIAREQDRVFVETTQRLAASAVAGRGDGLRAVVVDYANWDAAHAGISESWNAAWVRDNIYSSVADAMFVFRADGSVRFAWFNEAARPRAAELQAAAIPAAAAVPGLRRLARAATPEATSAYTHALESGRWLMIAVAPVTVEAQARRLTPQLAGYDYIAMVDVVDADEVAAFGSEIGLEEMAFAPVNAAPTRGAVQWAIESASGQAIGALQWSHRHPGSAAFRELIGWVVLGLLAIGALTILIARRIVARQIDAMVSAKAALDLSREKSEFLARVTSELRAPLDSVVGYAQLIQEEASTPAVREDAQHIIDAARRLGMMLNDIIDQSRINADALRFHPEVLPVAGLLVEVQSAISPVARMSGVEVSVARDGEAVYVYADHGRVRQCLLNVVGNAVKFSRRGSMVRVHARMEQIASGDHVVFDVIDDGIGIAPEAMPRLFRPFGQAHAAIGAVYGGAGLGLSIARSLARGMGGDLSVVSAPGAGATFSLRVPAAHARALERRVSA